MLRIKRLVSHQRIHMNIEELVMEVSETVNQFLRENIYEVNLSRKEYEILETRKKKLRHALKVCAVGNLEAKEYIKNMIIDVLTEKYGVSEKNINNIIAFDSIDRMSSWDKFQILLYIFAQRHGERALEQMFMQAGWEGKKIIRENDLETFFLQCMPVLSFSEKLDILTQRIYCLYKGLGVADDIREMAIDGVSGGVSGNDEATKSLWIFFKGQSINMSFLRFGSDKELQRICNNIYRNDRPGQLSRSRGYIVNDMADHSRVVVARPPFCESWVFFVRKFDKQNRCHLYELYKQKNHELVEEFLPYLVIGCQNCAITGAQGSGKTTLLMSLIEFIDESFNLRIQELAFELHLRDLYPERNIVTFRETDTISGQEGLDFQKKTDGTVNILGEVATAPVAGWMIQMGLTASLFTMFTHHAKTTKSLISSMTNALLSENIYQDEAAAKKQVIDVIRFDIHVGIGNDGDRRIERVTQILQDDVNYQERDLLVFKDDQYILKGKISKETAKQMSKYMDDARRDEFFEKFVE